jgi:hypothetical protein
MIFVETPMAVIDAEIAACKRKQALLDTASCYDMSDHIRSVQLGSVIQTLEWIKAGIALGSPSDRVMNGE